MKKELLVATMITTLAACGGGGGGSSSGGSTGGDGDSTGGGSTDTALGTVVANGSGVTLTDDGKTITTTNIGTSLSTKNGVVTNTYSFEPKSFFNSTSDALAAISIGSNGDTLSGISGTQVAPVSSVTYNGSYTLLSASSDFADAKYTGSGAYAVDVNAGTVSTVSGDLDIDATIDGGSLSGTATYTGSDFSTAAGKTSDINGGFYDTDGRAMAGVFEDADGDFVGAVEAQTF